MASVALEEQPAVTVSSCGAALAVGCWSVHDLDYVGPALPTAPEDSLQHGFLPYELHEHHRLIENTQNLHKSGHSIHYYHNATTVHHRLIEYILTLVGG